MTLMDSSTTAVISSANELLAVHSALVQHLRATQLAHRQQLHSLQSPPLDVLKLPIIHSPSSSPPPDDSPPASPSVDTQQDQRADLPPAKRARVARYHNYVPEEETIRNDYSQRYVDSGEWPQNWVLGAEQDRRFEEYPKQQRLLNLKMSSVNAHSLPPFYLKHSELPVLHRSKFDVILLDPSFSSSFTWDHLQELPIPILAADPSFVFMWVGSGAGEGLERGREVLAKWGYRRCEDVVWVKTNKTTNQGPGTDPPTTSLLTRTKQHCLIGIRGTVRRSTDSWFVHCNVDTDVIIWEGDPADPTRKPPEMYTLIENFCLGTRRLEIFGRPSSLRRGWVTVLGPGHHEHLWASEDGSVRVGGEEGGHATIWRHDTWEEGIKEMSNGNKAVVPMTQEIDNLRPKSPVRNGGPSVSSTGGSGGGMATNLNQNRFGSGNRGQFPNNNGLAGPGQMMGHNQMMTQPMIGMGVHQLGIGMSPPVGVEDMMGNWNPMLNGMNGMNVGGLGGLPNGGLGNISGVGGLGMNFMGQIGMNNGFQGPGPVFGANIPNIPMINGPMNGIGMRWGDQGQYGMEAGWDADAMMNMGVPGMIGGMNMGAMQHMNGMGMPNQWSGTGTYEDFR